MKPFARTLCLITVAGVLLAIMVTVPAQASTAPRVTALSSHHGVYWGAKRITVYGRNFRHVSRVMFGVKKGYSVHVVSSTRLTVGVPWHKYGTVHVRVVSSSGSSSRVNGDRFSFTRPTMNSRIQGGLTARQEQGISARVRAAHRTPHTAYRSSRWTAAMGVTAMLRARSWLGVPYSWAGGNSRGPTLGVCAHNGGDMDCHVVGFDCSGLALYAWAPYRQLVHYAATQHSRAGRFHPTIGQLVPGDLVFFSGYIANGIGHVAVYEGRGMVIQAEQSGTTVMRSRLVDVIAHSGRYRGATRPASTGRQASGPHLSTMTSQVSLRGGYLTITGSGLATATSVSVGGKMLYSFAARSSARLVVKAPAHVAGRVTVAVSNPWGTSTRSLTYVGAPLLSALTPARGSTAGGTGVTVSGRNLTSVTKVAIGTTAARFRALSTTQLAVAMPAHAAGAVRVTVYTRFGTSNQRIYTYVAPTPTTSPPTTGAPPSEPATTAPPTSATSEPTDPATTETTAPPSTTPPSEPPTSPTTAAPSTTPSTEPPTAGSTTTAEPSASASTTAAG